MSNTLRTLLPLAIIVSILIGYNFISAQWTPAPGAPTGGNTAAPINVSSSTQAKAGSLASYIFAATHQMRSNQYCDAMGLNCFTATSTGGGGDTVTVGGICFEPAFLVNCFWNWSGDGNDVATYTYYGNDPTQGCVTSNRTYQSHSTVLAKCAATVFSWSVSAFGACSAPATTCANRNTSGTQTRTVVCVNGSGQTVPDSNCAGVAKPATSQACSRTHFGGCGDN